MSRAFHRILVANRGEIAIRVFHSARALGYGTVAVYSDADANAAHVAAADLAVRIGPSAAADSYLSIDAIIEAARRTESDAIHPGYGFLAESPAFAQACLDAGLIFIGPSPAAMRTMGDKAQAKACMREAGIACIPGYDGAAQDDVTFAEAAAKLGFPLLVKAAAGGGGRGMRRADVPTALGPALASARAEARAAFGDDRLLLERLVIGARHIEVQVMGDKHGAVIHLGERDCSTQRRHQKIIEEAPSPAVDDSLRERLGATAVAAARAVGYVGAGTVELLLDPEGAFFFLEMNTRLQVEHPVTEAITGLDLVELQLRIAAGEALPLAQPDVRFEGHAIEVRLYAEDPVAGFVPRTGCLLHWHPATAEGLRCDSGVRSGQEIGADYDPLLAKLIAHGADRDHARARLRWALEHTECLGLPTNREWAHRLLAHPRFLAGQITVDFVERELEPAAHHSSTALVALAAALHTWGPAWRRPDPWRSAGSAGYPLALRTERQQIELWIDPRVDGTQHVRIGDTHAEIGIVALAPPLLRARIDGVDRPAIAVWARSTLHLQLGAEYAAFDEIVHEGATKDPARDTSVFAPSAGRVTAVEVGVGERVAVGQIAIKLEAMKIETSLGCAAAGTVGDVRVRPGDHVTAGQLLVAIEPAPGTLKDN